MALNTQQQEHWIEAEENSPGNNAATNVALAPTTPRRIITDEQKARRKVWRSAASANGSTITDHNNMMKNQLLNTQLTSSANDRRKLNRQLARLRQTDEQREHIRNQSRANTANYRANKKRNAEMRNRTSTENLDTIPIITTSHSDIDTDNCDNNVISHEASPLSENINNVRRTRDHRVSWQPVAQEWDFEHACDHCGCIWLKSAVKLQRRKCCLNGKAIVKDNNKSPPSVMPELYILPDILSCLILERGKHFGINSAKYNNILSIAATGVENGRGGGFEQVLGDSCVKVNGKIYSYLPKINHGGSLRGGIGYFTFDNQDALLEHADLLNNMHASIRPDDRINKFFLVEIYRHFMMNNPIMNSLKRYGDKFKEMIAQYQSGTTFAGTIYSDIQQIMLPLLKQSINVPSSVFTVRNLRCCC